MSDDNLVIYITVAFYILCILGVSLYLNRQQNDEKRLSGCSYLDLSCLSLSCLALPCLALPCLPCLALFRLTLSSLIARLVLYCLVLLSCSSLRLILSYPASCLLVSVGYA
jgi:hypothetical protein